MKFNRTKNLQLSVIKQMELRASKHPDVISLAQGIPGFDTPACIKRRVERALDRGVVAKYSLSSGLPELRELIELDLAKNNMFYDWEKEIVVTAGAIEGITATILAITSQGDEIIIPSPTYTSYREVINLAGCKPVYVPLDERYDFKYKNGQEIFLLMNFYDLEPFNGYDIQTDWYTPDGVFWKPVKFHLDSKKSYWHIVYNGVQTSLKDNEPKLGRWKVKIYVNTFLMDIVEFTISS